MDTQPDNSSTTRLTNHQFEECMDLALKYLNTNPKIRNRDIRAVAEISYDQAIHFFNRAITEELLIRMGNGSGTHYILPSQNIESQQ